MQVCHEMAANTEKALETVKIPEPILSPEGHAYELCLTNNPVTFRAWLKGTIGDELDEILAGDSAIKLKQRVDWLLKAPLCECCNPYLWYIHGSGKNIASVKCSCPGLPRFCTEGAKKSLVMIDGAYYCEKCSSQKCSECSRKVLNSQCKTCQVLCCTYHLSNGFCTNCCECSVGNCDKRGNLKPCANCRNKVCAEHAFDENRDGSSGASYCYDCVKEYNMMRCTKCGRFSKKGSENCCYWANRKLLLKKRRKVFYARTDGSASGETCSS